MGPPNSHIVSAIGDTVNVCARLESLSKTYGSPLIVSREAAQAAGLDTGDATLHDSAVSGRRGTVRFYALAEVKFLT